MSVRIMLDLETLGNQPGSSIVTIGAVKFDDGHVFDEFYRRITLDSCARLGLTMDPGTVLWWMERSAEARFELTAGSRVSIAEALWDFIGWVPSGTEIWGNGASFDNVLLTSAYERAGAPRPWTYKEDRCYRTVKNLHPEIPFEPAKTAHHALQDATAQAKHLIKILQVTKQKTP